MENPNIRLSEIDEERFGVRSARAFEVKAETLGAITDFCRANQVLLLMARCSASDIRAAQAMEREGFLLMDTLVYYVCDMAKRGNPQDSTDITVRPVKPGEEAQVEAIAIDSFRNYFGHYHADERLDRVKCDEAYRSWALRSCKFRDVANEVLVALLQNRVVAFASLCLNNSRDGEGVLFGVAPSAQGQGIYRSLMVNGMQWCLAKGRTRMVVSTQITNIAVQKVWTRLGFESDHAVYTFHKWFDDPTGERTTH